MNHRHNFISLNTDGTDFPDEFDLIKRLIEINGMKSGQRRLYDFHCSMEHEFGPNWRITAFHIIDVSSWCEDEREELLKVLSINCYRDCDNGFDHDVDLKLSEIEESLNENQNLLKQFRYYLHTDEVTQAEDCAVHGLAISDLPIEMIIEFLSFFVRQDFGYRVIARYSDKLISNLNENDRKLLIDFLLKLIELNYLEKLDLSTKVVCEIVKLNNKEN